MSLLTLKKKIQDWWEIQTVIRKAFNSKGFFITVSHKVKTKENETDLNHFWTTRDFPTKSILPSLQSIFNDLDKKELLFNDLLKSNKERHNE